MMFWNVENFFEGRPHFQDKCNGIAKTILLGGDEFGAVPDLVALAEVENGSVLRKLVQRTALRKLDYSIVHYDSPDHRGIDCALLYRRSRFRELYSKPCHLTDSLGRILPTRDILLVVLEPSTTGTHGPSASGKGPVRVPQGAPGTGIARPQKLPVALAVTEEDVPPEGRNTRGSIAGGPSRRDGGVSPPGELPKGVHLHPEQLAVLVNHHPSKVGRGSEVRRRVAMERLLELRDSLLAEGISRIIAVGDFNEEVTPDEDVQAAYPQGAGTIRFQGRWEKIDGCPVLEGFEAREHIFAPPHLSTRDSRYPGLKPLRTFSGPRYLGGLSDHYPIILEIQENYLYLKDRNQL